MKCNHCGSEWTVNPTISNSITACPFCGEALLSDKESPCTTESVLAKIYKQYGIGVLLDGQKLISFFSDLAPHLMKERRILKYFIECNGAQKINNVVGSSENEQAICVKQLIKEMKDELFIEESASRMICKAFISVLLPNHSLMDYSDSHTNPESSLGFPIVEMKQSPPEMTAEEQYCKASEYYNGPNSSISTWSKALEWYQKAALRGHVKAQYQLGSMYLIGAGTQKDLSKAFQWFLAAADQSYSLAQSKVGLCYAEGYGVAQDYEKAKLWFSKAAAQGDSSAKAWLENPDYPFLTKDRVVSLVEKYHLQDTYIVEGTPEFQKKYPKAKNAYAFSADAEGPLLMEDTTIFGSAKEGLVLTKKSLFFNGVATGKGMYPISEINSVGLYSDSTLYQKYVVLKTAPHLSDEEGRPIILSSTFLEKDAKNLGGFWQDLLMLSVDD